MITIYLAYSLIFITKRILQCHYWLIYYNKMFHATSFSNVRA